jgi:CBS domain containing-hemolysin-like protein
MTENSWKFFFILTLSCLIVQAFFAMVEMACVSFNKVRLQYYVAAGNRRAKWLSFLLNRPPQLFGTVLIGVNTALQLGSESSRRLYDSLGLSPDWAPLTQVIFVIIFAEIAPMVAGRRYAEHAAMIGIPILYFCSILFRPIIWLFNALCQLSNRLIGSPAPGKQYLSREELQKILEEREEVLFSKPEKVEFNTIVANIFSLKNKTAKELMQPLESIQMIPAFCSVAELRTLLTAHYTPYIPIYHRRPENIVAIAYPRDLLRLNENKRVREHARSPWFITENTSILQILKQFRRNNQSIAVVLNEAGLAIGILTLDEIIDEIFGRSDQWMAFGDVVPEVHRVFVDRTFSGDMKIKDFNEKYHVKLEAEEEEETFEELMTRLLGHRPSKGEALRIDQFELTVEEAPLIGNLTIAIRTIH